MSIPGAAASIAVSVKYPSSASTGLSVDICSRLFSLTAVSHGRHVVNSLPSFPGEMDLRICTMLF